MREQDSAKKIFVNGVELSYVERGCGDPVVFVHGSLSDFRTWSLQVRPFSRLYRVISYSLRYHYPNQWAGDGTDYSATLHAEDLAELIKSLNLGRAHIVASSYGAYAALFLAARHPNGVRTLVLGEPPVLPLLKNSVEGNSLLTAFMRDAWEPSQSAIEDGAFEHGVRFFIDGVLGKGSFDQLPPAARNNMMDNVAAKKAEISTPRSLYFPTFTRDDARRIQAPTLLLTGHQSPTMFHVITDILQQWLPHTERASIPGASHAMHVANPQAYNETVRRFLAKH